MGKLTEFCQDFWHNYHDLKNNIDSHTGLIMGVGIVTGLVGTFFACKATVKMVEKAEEHRQLIADTKANCAEQGLDEKATSKEVMKAYRHITVDYVRKYWPAVGLLVVGYGLVIHAHNVEVAKNEALLSAYIGLEQFLGKYRARVAERVGAEQEAEIFKQAQIDQANENVIGEYAGDFVNGSYLMYNENCAEYELGCPQANAFMADTIQREIDMKFETGAPVYVNDLMRAAGHTEIAGGYQWIWRKGLTDKPDFKLHDPDHNPLYARGYGFDPNHEEVIKFYLYGAVHVSQMYTAEYRQYLREDRADGGVIGGKIGKDPVIIG